MNYIILLNEGSTIKFKFYKIFGYASILCLLFILFSFHYKYSVINFLIIILPFFIIYLFLFGYDNRHITTLIPFLSFSISLGIFAIIEKFKLKKFSYPKFVFLYGVLGLFLMILLTINHFRGEDRLILESEIKKMKRGNIQLNTLLYHFTENDVLKIFSVADQLDMRFLPKLKNRIESIPNCDNSVLKKLKEKHKNHYIIIDTKFCKKTLNQKYDLSSIKKGYKQLFKFKEYYLLKKD